MQMRPLSDFTDFNDVPFGRSRLVNTCLKSQGHSGTPLWPHPTALNHEIQRSKTVKPRCVIGGFWCVMGSVAFTAFVASSHVRSGVIVSPIFTQYQPPIPLC